MASSYFELSASNVTVGITITEQEDGTLLFNLDVLDDSGSIGDLNGLFFDIADPTLLNSLTIAGADVTESVIKEDSVTKVDGYNNVNGEVANEYGKFDVGIQFGTSGMAQDDIQSTSFTLSSDLGDLTLDSFLSQDFAVRLTSVGEIDGDRGDSLKIGGTAPDEPISEDTINIANDDVMTVLEWEGFNAPGEYDEIGDNGTSLLENDTTDEGAYTGDVIGVNSMDLVEGSYAGSAGGLLIVTVDGQVDFSANGDFDGLEDGETGQTTFTYMIEGGDTAILTVNVIGESGPENDFPPEAEYTPGDDGIIPDDEWVEPGFEIG